MSAGVSPSNEQIAALVVRAQEGERAAFEALYDHFYGRIYRYLSFKTADAMLAEDLAEEVFLRMLTSIGRYQDRGYPFSSWLFRIAHNLAVDHFRKHGRHRTVSLDDVAAEARESETDLDSYVQTKLTLREVDEAMKSLTDLQRQVITMRFAGQLSVKETAAAMGRKENAVKALQHAGIKKLRRILVHDSVPAHQPG